MPLGHTDGPVAQIVPVHSKFDLELLQLLGSSDAVSKSAHEVHNGNSRHHLRTFVVIHR